MSRCGPVSRRPRILLADRGDPLAQPLGLALGERFDVLGRLDAELSSAERALVAAATYRPSRRQWVERFHKSNVGVGLRSRRARTGLRGCTADVVFQTHALFDTSDPRTVLYVDCTHHQSMDQWPQWNPLRGRSLERWLDRERRQYQRAAHVFAFSQETAGSLGDDYDVPADRVSVVGAGLNVGALPAASGPAAGRHRRAEPPTVLFVGNDFERKGGPELQAAFVEVRRRVPGARLRIVGAARPGRDQGGVEHLGRVRSRETLAELYGAADVFCLPSHFDPFPGALIEAMAFGLPCVVTTSCGIPEIVEPGRTALTIGRGPTMVAQLAEALTRLLLDPAAAGAMGQCGRERVEERFTWGRVVDRMTPALERLAPPVRTVLSR